MQSQRAKDKDREKIGKGTRPTRTRYIIPRSVGSVIVVSRNVSVGNRGWV